MKSFKITVIFIVLELIKICFSFDGDYPGYYDHPFGPYNGPHNEGPPYETERNFYHQQQCNCIKIKSCQLIMDFISKSRPLSPQLIRDIRKTSCGFSHGEPMICCPQRIDENFFRKTATTEKPWIWEVKKESEEKPNKFYTNEFIRANYNPNTKYQTISSHHGNNFHNFKEINDHFNLIDFEDPGTSKNCPPSFYDEFDAPIKGSASSKNTKTQKKNPFNRTNLKPVNFQNRTRPTKQSNSLRTGIINRNTNENLVNSPLCGISVNTRIVGGKDAGPGQFPWMARLAYRNRTSGKLTYRCAGSVINDRYVVTAAHCVTNLIDVLEVYLVRIGELETNRNLDCSVDPIRCSVPQDYEIDKIIPHPNYDTPKYANDIALIRLLKPFNASEMTPICLPLGELSSTDKELTGKTGVIAGWGSRTSGRSFQSPALQWVRLPIVNRTQCAISYAQFSANSRIPIIVSSSQLCVQGKENMDACQGDSGGPLMSEGSSTNLRYTLLGLVSFGPRTCGVSNFPGVYTRISAYMNWIQTNIET